MAENHSFGDPPRFDASPDPADEVVFRTAVTPSTRLRTHVVVTRAPDGRHTALVSLAGELCAFTAPAFEDELDQLLRNGVVGLVVDLRDLTFCTSHGVDVLAAVHQRLQAVSGGTLDLLDPVGVVDRVLRIVRTEDPTFTPPVRSWLS